MINWLRRICTSRHKEDSLPEVSSGSPMPTCEPPCPPPKRFSTNDTPPEPSHEKTFGGDAAEVGRLLCEVVRWKERDWGLDRCCYEIREGLMISSLEGVLPPLHLMGSKGLEFRLSVYGGGSVVEVMGIYISDLMVDIVWKHEGPWREDFYHWLRCLQAQEKELREKESIRQQKIFQEREAAKKERARKEQEILTNYKGGLR